MKITDFNLLVAAEEGGKNNLDIAQISEVIRIANDLTDGDLYRTIRSLEEDDDTDDAGEEE